MAARPGAPWRTVLIGAGRMGMNHLRVLLESPQFSLVGVVDPRIGDIASTHDFPAGLGRWKDIDDCLKQAEFEVAVIAATTAMHFAIARRMIEAGKHILIEKPLATTYDESMQLVGLSKKRDVLLKVGHLERLNPAVRKLKEVIDAGWVGTPIHFSFTRVGGYPARVGSNNNVLMDLAVHDIDVMHYLMGARPPFNILGVASHSTWRPGILDTVEILLEKPKICSASIHVNWVTPTKIRTVRVTGTRGVCMIDYMLQTCVLYGGDLLKNHHEPKVAFEELIRLYQSSDRIEFGVNREEPLKVQLKEFDQALRGEASRVCDALEAAATVDVAERALAAQPKPRAKKAAA